ncbi:MAG: hypothetical protein Q9M91_02065 [Candidatus Dojkabacteria bacterium]|nr:hypothetical protein [Candidatus Dojkabacteria bacterium]MDQ7020609.1 hypothetical protein [Candidatus Dojkabacteria bacterium]
MATIFESSITKRLDQYLANSQKKSYFVAAVTLVFTLVIFLFGIRPAITASIRQYNDNKERTDVIVQLESKLDSLKSLTEQESLNADVIDYFRFLLPSKDRGDYIFDELTTYLNSNNIEISSIQWVRNDDQFEQLSGFLLDPPVVSRLVNIQGSTEIGDLVSFLNIIEESRRIYNVRSLQIFPVNSETLDLFSDLKPFTFNLEVQYFYWNDEIVIK